MQRKNVVTTDHHVVVSYLSNLEQATLLSPVKVDKIVVDNPSGKYATERAIPPVIEIHRDEMTNKLIAVVVRDMEARK